MRPTRSVVISMRLPTEIGNRLKRMALGMDGRQAMRALGWLRRASDGRNSRLSTSAIRLRADKLISKGARSLCGR